MKNDELTNTERDGSVHHSAFSIGFPGSGEADTTFETDAFHLPDTAGVSYGIGHQKTTIVAQFIDLGMRIAEVPVPTRVV